MSRFKQKKHKTEGEKVKKKGWGCTFRSTKEMGKPEATGFHHLFITSKNRKGEGGTGTTTRNSQTQEEKGPG